MDWLLREELEGKRDAMRGDRLLPGQRQTGENGAALKGKTKSVSRATPEKQVLTGDRGEVEMSGSNRRATVWESALLYTKDGRRSHSEKRWGRR